MTIPGLTDDDMQQSLFYWTKLQNKHFINFNEWDESQKFEYMMHANRLDWNVRYVDEHTTLSYAYFVVDNHRYVVNISRSVNCPLILDWADKRNLDWFGHRIIDCTIEEIPLKVGVSRPPCKVGAND